MGVQSTGLVSYLDFQSTLATEKDMVSMPHFFQAKLRSGLALGS